MRYTLLEKQLEIETIELPELRHKRTCKGIQNKLGGKFSSLSYLLLLSLLVSSCAKIGLAPKSDKPQIDMCLQKNRTDIEELRHDLHSQKMELNILSGKIVNQTEAITSLKKESLEVYQEKVDNSLHKIENLEKKILLLERTQGELGKSIQQISFDTYEIRKALSQGKERINELEKLLSSSFKSKPEKPNELLHSKADPPVEQQIIN